LVAGLRKGVFLLNLAIKLTLYFLLTLFNNANALELKTDNIQINPAAAIEYLEDELNGLTLQEVSSGPSTREFKPAPIVNGIINFGFSTSNYWFRLPLQRTAKAQQNWLIEIPFFYLDHIEFYAPDKPPVTTGSGYPFNSRPVFNRFYVFPVELSTAPQYFYFKIHTSSSLTLPVTLWQTEAFSIATQKDCIIQSLYYGGLSILVIYSLLLFISLRDKLFLYYSLYGLSIGLGMLAGNGQGKQFLWPTLTVWDQVSQYVLLSFAAMFAVLFSQRYLQTKTYAHNIHRWLTRANLSYGVITTLLMTSLFIKLPVSLILQVFMIISVAVGVTLISTTLKMLYRRHKGARFFLLAWATFWSGAIIAILRSFGVMPTNAFTAYALQIATAVEMLFLAFAMADRLILEKRLKEQAEHALITSLKNSEEKLEQQVKARTQELEQSVKNEKDIREQYIRFGSLISHEFRNQFGIIQNQLTLIIAEYEAGISQLDKRLPIIKNTTQRLTLLFDKWLQNSQFKNNINDLSLQHIELSTYLHELLDNYTHHQEQHRFVLELNPKAENIAADKALLTLALQNLMDNACKYSASGHLVTLQTRHKEDSTGIAVLDEGMGIARKNHDLIFSEYFRVNPENNIPGMGLGLNLVQRIVKVHGGTIELESTPGSGSCFCIWLNNRNLIAL
jgi:signal transduction histidine kinase